LTDDEKRKQLDWKGRLSIINGIARGLLYLHKNSRLTSTSDNIRKSLVMHVLLTFV